MNWFTPENLTLSALVAFGATAILRMILLFAFGYTAYYQSVGTRWEKPVRLMLIPVFAFGYIYDVFLNHTVAAVLFWERPEEKTISERMTRYLRTDHGWRFSLSAFFCRLLDRFDKGHCGRPHNPATVLKIIR